MNRNAKTPTFLSVYKPVEQLFLGFKDNFLRLDVRTVMGLLFKTSWACKKIPHTRLPGTITTNARARSEL